MTHSEYQLRYDILQLDFDFGYITEQEYYKQLEALTEKFSQGFERRVLKAFNEEH